MRVRPTASPRWRLARVAETLGGQLTGDDVEVTGGSLSTADVVAGDLFAARPGATTHGARFAAKTTELGAVAVMTDAGGAGQVPAEVPTVLAEGPSARFERF